MSRVRTLLDDNLLGPALFKWQSTIHELVEVHEATLLYDPSKTYTDNFRAGLSLFPLLPKVPAGGGSSGIRFGHNMDYPHPEDMP